MALSKTGLTTLRIKDPLPDVVEDTVETQAGFLATERASTRLVAGQTEVNPLSVDLVDTQLMSALTNYTDVNFNATLADPTVIGKGQFTTYPGIAKRDDTTGEYIPKGDYSATTTFDQQMTDIVDKGQTDFTTLVGESYKDYRNRLRTRAFSGADEFGIIMAGQEPYTDAPFLSTEDYVSSINRGVVGNIADYRKRVQPMAVTMFGAGKMIWGALNENALIKGLKKNPSKYAGNIKYIKGAEGWFAKQAQKQFGAIFEDNPESAIRIAEANRVMYEYLQSTQEGQQKARDMGLNLDSINKNYEQAKAFETAANQKATGYSAYQGKYSGSAEGVAAKKSAYTNMSKRDLDDTTPAGFDQYSGMAIGGKGVYVDISDGIESGTKFKSGTIFVKWKKEEREKRAAEEKVTKKEPEVITRVKEEDQAKDAQQQREKQAERQAAVERTSSRVKEGKYRAYGLQEGGPIGNPMGQQQQQQQPLQDAGNLELIQEQGKDQSGVADDVQRKLNEGDFVINAPAMEMAGRGDIERMITKAITELQRKGIKLDFGQAAEDVDSIVQALVSNKEMIIPKIIAEQIGYDRLEKINNRGKERVDEIEKEQQQQDKGFVQGQPQTQRVEPQQVVQMGGQITLEENKNQPIAVPRESFATMSSVGKRLLSPLSPEQADKELTELTKPSQSFEGFLKPIRMHGGDTVQKNHFTNEKDVQDYNKDIITRMIMSEALDNPKEWEAMTNVVLNRIKDYSDYMPSDQGKTNIENIILGKNQFQGLEVNQEIYNNPGATVQGLEKYKKVSNIVQNVLEGKIEDNTDGATYFDKSFIGAGIKFGDHWFHKNGKPIIPEIKLKPQQTGMMAVN